MEGALCLQLFCLELAFSLPRCTNALSRIVICTDSYSIAIIINNLAVAQYCSIVTNTQRRQAMELSRFERPDLEWLRPIYQAVVAHCTCPPSSCNEAWNSAPSDEDWNQRYKRNPTMPSPVSLNDLAEAVFSIPLRFAVLASDLHARGHSVNHALRVAYNCYQQFLLPSRQESWAFYQDVHTSLEERECQRPCCLQDIDNNMYLHAERLPHGWAVFEPQFERHWYAMCLHESGVWSGTEEGRLYRTLSQIISDESQRQFRWDMSERPTVVEHAGSFSYLPNQPCSELGLRGGDTTHAWNRLFRYRLDGVQIPSTRDAFLRGESLEREYFSEMGVGDPSTPTEPSASDIIQANIDATQALSADYEPIPAEEAVVVPSVDELEHRVSRLCEELDENIHAQEHVVGTLRAQLRLLEATDPELVAEYMSCLDTVGAAQRPELVVQLLRRYRAECCRLAGRLGSLREIEEQQWQAEGDEEELVGLVEAGELCPASDGEAEFRTWLWAEGGALGGNIGGDEGVVQDVGAVQYPPAG
ncbi:uncharacterized protein BDZ99DRAFT_196626 [Mytilinidion resinicola]|uniref:Uncharacterized protein n=1 Tax=Mytilinidion resinicola TaxID=574789 RepID=A0A6A6Z5I9_9PEZI|nr:uncharacterized protein BDZ99DRAFT_196626 [Mytilinidion resinicola]KAF2815465.1 hypothetical protein BDZ99DRAFT_196626 [Mytilinidion resinicola]